MKLDGTMILTFNNQIYCSHSKLGVLIAFFRSFTYTVRKKASDKRGRILVRKALVD